MKAQWRCLIGIAILAVVAWRTGHGPFVLGVRALDAQTLVLGAGLTALTTTACAWRWHLVAKQLDVGIRVPAAVAACYRAQFLNTVLPGGVLGDVHRGVVHGRSMGATGRALRAVAWERFAGQVVLAAVAMVVLLVLPSPVRAVMPGGIVLVIAVLVAVAMLARRASLAGPSWGRRVLRAVHHDVRSGLLGRRSWPGVVAASGVAIAGYAATYLLAARAVGVTAPLSTLLPLTALVLLAAGLPLNFAGWGPREGMAAWAFAGAGLGAGPGVATAVAFGAMVFVANLPGLILLLTARDRSAERREPVPHPQVAAGGGSRV